MVEIIEQMKSLGWVETSPGVIVHPDGEKTFASWFDAVIACIQVASE